MNHCEILGQRCYYRALKNGEVKSQFPSAEGWLSQPDSNGFLHTSFKTSVSGPQNVALGLHQFCWVILSCFSHCTCLKMASVMLFNQCIGNAVSVYGDMYTAHLQFRFQVGFRLDTVFISYYRKIIHFSCCIWPGWHWWRQCIFMQRILYRGKYSKGFPWN